MAVHALRVNVKSLAAEARFIRQEIRRADSPEAKEALAIHRMVRLKPEARLAHLALAFVRGRKYRQAENHARQEVNVQALTKKVNKFVAYGDRVSETAITKWVQR